VAVALVEGAALLPQYQNEKLADPSLLRLSRMVEVGPDPALPRGVSCLMTLETDSGRVYRSQVDHPRGSIAKPMTAEEMNGKGHLLADGVIGRPGADTLGDAVRNVTALASIDELTRLVIGARATGDVPSHA
jgi:2-methylcitrate dehydratase PrpD